MYLMFRKTLRRFSGNLVVAFRNMHWACLVVSVLNDPIGVWVISPEVR